MHLTNFAHPITQGLPQDLFWNTPELVGPVFYLQDPRATELGQVVSSLGRCKPGFGVKEFSGGDGTDSSWRSIYLSTPNMPPAVLRGIARYAGVHLYNEDGDVLYATPDLLGVHTVAGGPRTFKLPRRVEVVYDLYQNCIVAENTDAFQVQLPPASTALYFTGKASMIP